MFKKQTKKSQPWDRSFKVWRSTDFKCLESIANAQDDAIKAIVLSDEGFVYTGSVDKKIKVCRYHRRDKKHHLTDKLEHHKSAVNSLAYDDHMSVLISSACSGAMIARERNSGGRNMLVVGALLGHKKAILCMGIIGELECNGSADKMVRLWRSSDDGEEEGRWYTVYNGSLDSAHDSSS
ncbi:hypothetical protein L1887_23584 [Cichorium endivia]|nr:hypothetical protein L1887_23584 [Cichorium endivia]